MSSQFELNFAAPADRPQGEDTERLVLCLAGRGWQTGLSLRTRLGWTERRLRAVASGSKGRVLSWPGSKGYCLTAEAATEDIDHACAALTSQARDMLSRAEDIRQATQMRSIRAISQIFDAVESAFDQAAGQSDLQHQEERE
jgi:hypothetical protein